MQHVINKQLLELVLNKKQDAFHIQQQMSDFYRRHIVPMLGEIFDSLAPEDEVLHFGRVVIDLGKIDMQYIEQSKAPEGLYNLLFDQISGAATALKEQQKTSRPYTLSVAGQWLFYMEHGYLPWNTIAAGEEWLEKALQALASDYDTVTRLRNLIRVNPTAVRRLVYQHDETFIGKLIAVLTAETQTDLPAIVNDLCIVMTAAFTNRNKNRPADKDIRQAVWQLLLTVAAVPHTGAAAQRLVTHVTESLVIDMDPPALIRLEKQVSHGILRSTLLQLADKRRASHNAKTAPVFPPKQPAVTSPDAATTPKTDPPKHVFEMAWEKLVSKAASSQTMQQAASVFPEEGVFVSNAGLVLLHPFLKTFFTRLGFVQNGAFPTKEACQKAVHSLFYLAHGSQTPEEHALVIPKVLCAYPIHETLERDIRLSEEELKEADDLLVAAIAQWTIVKNTSADGLREGFLQRQGKLSSRKDALYLQVETNSIDVLLDYLPWSLSMIKLPWREDILHVEWR